MYHVAVDSSSGDWRDRAGTSARYVDDGRRCPHCRWYLPLPKVKKLGCTHPWGSPGMSGPHYSCCSWEREPGIDDDLGERPLVPRR